MTCDKTDSEPNQSIQVSYAQTSCDDPWARAGQNTPVGFQGAVEQYLQPKGIQLNQVQVSTGAAEVCRACFCKTGLELHAAVKNEDLSVLLDLGFQQK